MAKALSILVILCAVVAIPTTAPLADSTLTLDEFTRGKLSVSIPLSVTVPSNLIPFDPGMAAETWWLDPKEVEHVRNGDPTSGETAHFTAKVTRNMGYDSKRSLFRVGASTESSMAAELSAAEMRDVSVERRDTGGYPILIVEATSPSGQRTRLAYVALKVGNDVLLLYMTASNSNVAEDARAWDEFKKTLTAD
jgi:hypothetical protein